MNSPAETWVGPLALPKARLQKMEKYCGFKHFSIFSCSLCFRSCPRSTEHHFEMKAIPCGLTIPVTTGVITPVSRFNLPTEVGVAV